jgi:S-DNA-T family DNA segregation ATPase FtsK/SpoIIIE
MVDNEYTPKEKDNLEKDNSKRKTNEAGNKKSQEKEIKSPSAKIKKIKTILGALLVLAAVFFFIAFTSYIFTWKIDQDAILNTSFFDYIFNSAIPAPENWLGKFGAWMSHVFIFSGFGIVSFGICLILFILGIKLLFSIDLLPFKRTATITASFMIWGSFSLGYFSKYINFLGGTFGFYLNQWLITTIGSIGTISLILVALYLIITILFNPNYALLFSFLSFKKDKELESNNKDNDQYEEDSHYSDMHVINTIKDDEIEKENISETIHFDEEEEVEEEVEEEEEESDAELIDLTEDDDFEVEVAKEEALVEIPVTAETAPKEDEEGSLAEKLVAEFGVYDPTKDLDGYLLPPIDLLKEYPANGSSVSKEELEGNKNRIVETLSNYKIDIAKIKATVGPTVTLYEIVPAPGVRISKIKNLEDDIALSLSALGIRIIAPIPGKGTIGIEVPNLNPEMVSMRSLIASEKFQNFDAELPIVLGKTITNETYVFDLTRMPHLLVAGSTGQGKSVGLNAILISLLYRKHPAQVKFVLVDPKKVELTLYNKIERHYLAKLPGNEDAIITDTSKVVHTLNSLCIEMDDRYELLKIAEVRTIKEYNTKFIARRLNPEKGHRYLPYIVVLIDEFADLIMTAGKEVEHPIARIAQLARAIGIHLIVATQRPSVNVITGMIKANFPARMAFRVLSKIDSRTILDTSGADQLIGRGDMLITSGSDMIRLQCGFVDTPEVESICNFIGGQRAYPEALILPEYIPEGSDSGADLDMNEIDAMFVDSARIVIINQQGSASLLQRKLKLGYNRAGRIVDQLEGMGIIGPFQGSKAREVLFSDIESLDEFLRTRGLI